MAKILFYTDSGYYSGAEIYFSRLIGFTLDEGYQVGVLVSPAFERSSHPVWSGVVGRSSANIAYIASGSKLNFSYVAKLWRYLKTNQPDLIVCNMWSPYANTWLLVLAWLSGIKVLAIEHFYQEKSDIGWPLRPLKLFAYRLKRELVGQFATVSQVHKRVLVEEFGYPADRISVIQPGVDFSGQPIEAKNNARVELVYSGTLEPRKRPIFLLEALIPLRQENWHLTMLGQGVLKQEIETFIASHQLDSQVSLTGWVENAPEILLGSDIFVHPAISENFSAAIIEAMAAGLPVIANNVGGNPEIVTDGQTGRLIRPDLAEWSEALRQLIASRELRERMGQAGRRRYQDSLTLQGMESRFNRVVKICLEP